MYLAGDIGGTKTHLAIYKEKTGVFTVLREEKYPSKNFANLTEILEDFLSKGKETIERACFGIAGPIKDQVCRATNLPWVIDGRQVQKELHIKDIQLINDLEANAFGIKTLKEEEFFVLNKGVFEKNYNQALISAGTGLGEAGIFFNKGDYIPFACEGGHCDFSPRNEKEVSLLTYLKQKFGEHISYERVLSGPGLENLYHFLVHSKKADPIENQEGSLAKIISEKGLNGSCSICVEALDWFVSLYGAEAGNLALKIYALDGVFIGGGIAPKILKKLKEGIFMKAFLAKGRLSKALSQIPVKVVLNENTALLGAAYCAKNKKN